VLEVGPDPVPAGQSEAIVQADGMLPVRPRGLVVAERMVGASETILSNMFETLEADAATGQ
jgi:hypothetical protein